MGEYLVSYTPTTKQRMFHASAADEVLFGGAAGGGKSRAIVMDALLRCLTYAGTRAYIFRRTYGELEDTVIREALAAYPDGLYRYHGTRREISFPNGSGICFRHCQHAADRYLYKGAEIQWLYLDELTSFEPEVYDFLKTRLRAKKSLGVTPCVRCASNPGDIGHGWVKKRFVDAAPPGEVFENEVALPGGRKRVYRLQYIPALVTENPYIGEDYLFQLEQKPRALRDALLYGRWDAFEGQVFTEWTDDPAHARDRLFTHVIEPFDIPLSWPRWMSFDHGYSRPFSVGWWAVAPDGTAYRYREWYGCVPGQPNTGLRLTPREIAEGIIERERPYEGRENLVIRRVADPAVFDASRGESVARQMEPALGRPGVYLRPGDHTRLAGKMQIHQRLRFSPEGKPGLYVFSTCRDFIRTVPALPYSRTVPEDIDTAAEDHIYDETRYFCMANPLPERMGGAETPRGFSPFEERGRAG